MLEGPRYSRSAPSAALCYGGVQGGQEALAALGCNSLGAVSLLPEQLSHAVSSLLFVLVRRRKKYFFKSRSKVAELLSGG